MVYYLSMEFLMGRFLGNNIINICAQKEIKEALDELGFDLNAIEDQERGSGPWKRRPRPSGRLLFGFPGDPGISGLRLRHPLPLRHVQAEDRKRLPDGSSGRVAEGRLSL